MERGFFKSLFDFSFSSFVSVRLIRVIYALFVAVSALIALGFVLSSFARSAAFGLFALLIVAPVLFFFYVILARVYLELVVAIFRIAENTSILAGQGSDLSAPSPLPGGPHSPSPPAGSPPPPPPPPAPTWSPPPPPPPPPPPDQPSPESPPSDTEPPSPPAPPGMEPPPPPPPNEAPEEVPAPSPTRSRRQAPLRPRRSPTQPPPEPPE